MSYFLSPRKILFGKGMLKRLANELEGRGNKAILITDKNMAKFSGELVEAVKSAGYEVKIWDQAEQEPSTAGAERAFRRSRSSPRRLFLLSAVVRYWIRLRRRGYSGKIPPYPPRKLPPASM